MKHTAVIVLLAAGCTSRIPEGKVGLYVYASRGLDRQVLHEGLYWHLPWNHIIEFPAQWNEYEERMHVLTQDDVHLDVQAGIAIRPHIAELYQLQQDLGIRYYDTIVQSAFFTATRTVFAHYNMVDIPENSEKIEAEIREHVDGRIAGHHLELGRIALQHIDYPPVVQTAIEARLVTSRRCSSSCARSRIRARSTSSSPRASSSAGTGLRRDLQRRDVLQHRLAPLAVLVGPAKLQRPAAGGVEDRRPLRVVPVGRRDRLAAIRADHGDRARGRSEVMVHELAQRPRVARLAVGRGADQLRGLREGSLAPARARVADHDIDGELRGRGRGVVAILVVGRRGRRRLGIRAVTGDGEQEPGPAHGTSVGDSVRRHEIAPGFLGVRDAPELRRGSMRG